jgi:hypothetical protein
MIIFTPEQAEFIHKTLNMGPILLRPDQILISDGVVGLTDLIWWNCKGGPDCVQLADVSHFHNAREFPQYYSINKPTKPPEEYPDDC